MEALWKIYTKRVNKKKPLNGPRKTFERLLANKSGDDRRSRAFPLLKYNTYWL